jgi:hypothetical protein
MDDEPKLKYQLRHDGPSYEGDEHDWWAVQYRGSELEEWITAPRRFAEREDAEQYIKNQRA